MSTRPQSLSAAHALRLLILLVAAATFLALFSVAQSGFWHYYEGEPVPWVGIMRAKLTHWYTFALFVPALYWLARRFPLGRSPWIPAVAVHTGASLLFALLKESLLFLVADWFRPGIFSLREILAGDYLSEVVTFWALIGIVHAYVFYGDRSAPPAPAEPRSLASDEVQFTVRDRGGYRIVAAREVEWIDAQGNYAQLHSQAGAHLVRETMAGLEAQLGPGFMRVHRRAIVNLDRIARVEPLSHGEYRLVLASGDAVTSGRSYNRSIRALIR